ncbi:MAG: 1-deoxy-D-xylulose-5-phosphate reductoisomerase [Armatimonadota bacterium]
MIRVAVLGSTGSIGTQTLDVIDRLSDRLQVVALAAHSNVKLIAEQARKYGVRHLCLMNPDAAEALSGQLGGSTVLSGDDGLCALARLPEVDVVVISVSGVCGLGATLAAIEAGKGVALASKEVLVAAGESVMRLARERGVVVAPIDSEHSAIFQCLQGYRSEDVAKIFVTSSGGAVRDVPVEELPDVCPERALQHPNWSMGVKITIDSATLMNKSLEVIEACWLFNVPFERVSVIIHPQSIVHSLVEFHDGSLLAQLGLPDMRLPIQLALLHPARIDTGLPRLDLAQVSALSFSHPDPARYPSLKLATLAMESGGTMSAVMNAANELAVARFVNREIGFTQIVDLVRSVMMQHNPVEATLSNVYIADEWARGQALAWQG